MLAFAVLWLGLALYIVLAGADLGVGIWLLVAQRSRRRGEIERDALAYLSPRWEVNGLFLIFFLTGLFAAFSRALALLGRALLPTMLVALVLLVLRSAAYALIHAEPAPVRRVARWLFGLTSIGAAAALAVAAAAPASGALVAGAVRRSYYTSPLAITATALAVTAGAHLAAVGLAEFAARTGRPTFRWFRTAAITMTFFSIAGAASFTLAIADADDHVRRRLLSAYAAPMIAATLLLIAGVFALARGRTRPAALLTAAGYFGGLIGGAFAQLPYLVYPTLTLHEAAGPSASVSTFLIAAAAGGPLLIVVGVLYGRTLRAQPR